MCVCVFAKLKGPIYMHSAYTQRQTGLYNLKRIYIHLALGVKHPLRIFLNRIYTWKRANINMEFCICSHWNHFILRDFLLLSFYVHTCIYSAIYLRSSINHFLNYAVLLRIAHRAHMLANKFWSLDKIDAIFSKYMSGGLLLYLTHFCLHPYIGNL